MNNPTSSNPSFLRDSLLWNAASVLILAVCGLGLSLLTSRLYDADVFGVFNQALAVYTVASQLAVFGINLSVLHQVAGQSEKDALVSLRTGLFTTFVISALVTVVFVCVADPVGLLLKSPGVSKAMMAIAPALVAFSINKILLSFLSGQLHMRAHAVFQSARYLFLIFGFFLIYLYQVDGFYLASVFSIAELLLLLSLGFYLRKQIFSFREPNTQTHFFAKDNLKAAARKHLNFGARGVLGGAIFELNMKVDMLMAGYFLTDRETGIYGFAAMFIDGVFQIMTMLQNVYNPLLANHNTKKEFAALRKLILNGAKYTYAASIFLYPIVLGLFYLIVNHVLGSASITYQQSVMPFAILLLGIMLCSGFYPFQNILVMAGRPGAHSWYLAATLSVNVLLNIWWIPLYGINGAAIATAMSFIVSIFILVAMSKKYVRGLFEL